MLIASVKLYCVFCTFISRLDTRETLLFTRQVKVEIGRSTRNIENQNGNAVFVGR